MLRSIAVAAMLLASASASLAQNSPYFRWDVYRQGSATTPPTNPPTNPPTTPPVVVPETTPLQDPDPVDGNITLSPTYLPQGFEGDAYTASVTATGSNGTQGPFQYIIYDMPYGIDANDNVVSGTPPYAMETRTKILVVPTVGEPVTFERTIRVRPQVRAWATLPNAKVGEAYNRGSIEAFYGKGGPYTISVIPASLAGTGLTYNAAANRFDGTPTQAGTYTVQFLATDSTGAVGGGQGTLVVDRADLHLAVEVGTPRPVEKVGRAVATRYLKAKNAVGAVTYGATGLPAQVTVDPATGVFSGTPTTTGTHSVTFTAVDSANAPVSAGPFTITIEGAPNPSEITADYDVETMIVGKQVTETGNIQGGAPDEYNGEFFYYCRVGNGNSQDILPGVRLNGCDVSGTPTFPGTYTYTIQIIDSRINQTGWDEAISKEYTTTVLPGTDRSPFGLIDSIRVVHVDYPGDSSAAFVSGATTEQRKQLLQDGATSPAVLGVNTVITDGPGYDITYSVMTFAEPVVLSGFTVNLMNNTGNAYLMIFNDAGQATKMLLPPGTGNQTVSFARQPVWGLMFGPVGMRGMDDVPGEWATTLYQITEMNFVQ